MESRKLCRSCGRESPPLSASCIWCGAPFPEFELAAPPLGPETPRPPPALGMVDVPAPPSLRLARGAGVLGLSSGAVTAAFGAVFLTADPMAGVLVLALAAAGLVSGALAFRKRLWRVSIVLGAVGALGGLVSVVGVLLGLGAVALITAARDEFLS